MRIPSGLVIVPLLLLAGCGVFGEMRKNMELARQEREAAARERGVQRDEIEESLDGARDLLDQAGGMVDKVGSVHERAKKEADADGDGVIGGSEQLMYALLAAMYGKQEWDKRKAAKNQSAVVADLEGRIEHERAKRKIAEASELEALRAKAGKPA